MLLIPVMIGTSAIAIDKGFYDYALTPRQIDSEYRPDYPVACNLMDTEAKSLNTVDGKVNIIVKNYACHEPDDFKEGSRYITEFTDYFIVVDEIHKLDKYAIFCHEKYPYIRRFKLNSGRFFYYFDMNRDNHPDYGLPGNFPKNLVPMPENNGITCPQDKII